MFGIKEGVEKINVETIPLLRKELLAVEKVTLNDLGELLDRLDGVEIDISIKLRVPNKKDGLSKQKQGG